MSDHLYSACIPWIADAADHQDKVKAVQYWDTASPYHYVRTEDHQEHGLILIVGGEDHPTGIKPDQYEVGPHQHRQAPCT